MEGSKLNPAPLSEEALQILKEAESAINQRMGLETDPDREVYLIALNRSGK